MNTVLGCCVLSTLCIYGLNINLDALIVYANGIFIMIYLLCMLAGCRLLKGRFKALAVIGVCCAAAGDGGMEEFVRHYYADGTVAVLTEAQCGLRCCRPGSATPPGKINQRSSL
jgi:hypothetical protein